MHPLAQPSNISGALGMQVGDVVKYTIDGRIGTVDEFLSDGEALMTWNDGTYGTINWNHLVPA